MAADILEFKRLSIFCARYFYLLVSFPNIQTLTHFQSIYYFSVHCKSVLLFTGKT